MQTEFSPEQLEEADIARANDILRACVHCGFCNATCPTYQLGGDELDGPRGRIYLVRDLLQSGENGERATLHLDRCLTCRACETTCPSGVAYGELAEIARNRIGPKRGGYAGFIRGFLKWLVPEPRRLRRMARLGRWFRWMLPSALAEQVPASVGRGVSATGEHDRRVILLNGCAQQVVTPLTNQHIARLLDRHGVSTVIANDEGCCGSLDLHLGDETRALQRARRNVDALLPLLDSAEAIISSASGCGVTLKDYDRLLAHDPQYADAAARIAAAVMDIGEYLVEAQLPLEAAHAGKTVAWHAPCTLQHGQQRRDDVASLLTGLGYTLTTVDDAHLCCGAAGTYAVLERDRSVALRARKIEALERGAPDVIVSANVGCQAHLAEGASVPVKHWVELLE